MRSGALILTYHAVEDGPPPLRVSPELLARHLDCIVESRAPVLTVSELADRLQAGTLDGAEVALTFDDGLASTARAAAPLLAERGLAATIFCLADPPPGLPFEVARPDELAALAAAGWEIGSHGLAHDSLAGADPARLEDESTRSRRLLHETVGVVPSSFAYPFGHVPAAGRAALAGAGYAAGVTTRVALAGPDADPLALPRVDAHYLRRPSLLRAALEGRLGAYLGARSLGSRARRLVRPDRLALR